jgi:hypothetical protein
LEPLRLPRQPAHHLKHTNHISRPQPSRHRLPYGRRVSRKVPRTYNRRPCNHRRAWSTSPRQKSANLPGLDAATVDTLVAHAERAPSDHSTIDLWLNGGAISRVPDEATAFGNRAAPYLVGVEANWESPDDDEANRTWARALLADLERHGSAGVYLNFAGLPEEAAASARAGHGAGYERLAALKARYDPDNLFRHNQNVPPAT